MYHIGESALVGLTAIAIAGCGERSRKSEDVLMDSIAVLQPVPDLRGRAICRADTMATRMAGVLIADCELGDGLSIDVHADTIFAVTRKIALSAPDTGQTLLDYWNRHLRTEWEDKLGARADGLNSHASEYADRLEAIWDKPTRVRHMLTLERPRGQTITLEYLAIDCRPQDRNKQAIACW